MLIVHLKTESNLHGHLSNVVSNMSKSIKETEY